MAIITVCRTATAKITIHTSLQGLVLSVTEEPLLLGRRP